MQPARPLAPTLATLERAMVFATAGQKVVLRTDDGQSLTAAMGVPHEARHGDRVLVTRDGGAAYVVAVLGALRAPSAGLSLADGARAQREGDALTIRGADGELVIEHREGRTVVHGRDAVELRAGSGSLRLSARDDVEIDADRIRIQSRDGALELDEAGVELRGPRVRATGQRAELSFVEASYTGRAVSFCVDRARAALGVMETDAKRIVERAGQLYQEIEDVAELKAGRIRQIAEGTFSTLAERTLIRAEAEVAVKGSKIELG